MEVNCVSMLPLLFLFTFWGTWLSHCIPALANQDECREMSFPAFLFFAEKRLVDHTIKTELVPDIDECERLCYDEHNCVSINFEKNDNGQGTSKCELNNSTHREHDEDFVDTVGFFYHGTDNACGSPGPCQNGGTCQYGFTNKRYRCLCSSGFVGDNCEHDVDECGMENDCLANHAHCINTVGSYKCSCNHGYVGDGKTNCTKLPECLNYASLTEADRRSSYNETNNPKNDRLLGPGWFRFEGDAGTTMATSCPPIAACSTHATGWLNGPHPEVADGIVTREACFHHENGCCEWTTNIQVRNCSFYVVYYLHSTPYRNGNLRYCSSD